MLAPRRQLHFRLLLLLIQSCPDGERGSFRAGRTQLADTDNELQHAAGQPPRRAEVAAIRTDLGGSGSGGGEQNDRAEGQTEPPQCGAVEEDHHERRQQEDSGQQRAGRRSGQAIPNTMERRHPHAKITGSEAPEHAGRQPQHAVHQGGGQARRRTAFQAHDGRSAQHVGQRRNERDPRERQRELHQQSDLADGNHAVDQHADGDCRGQRQQPRDQSGRQKSPHVRRRCGSHYPEQIPYAGG